MSNKDPSFLPSHSVFYSTGFLISSFLTCSLSSFLSQPCVCAGCRSKVTVRKAATDVYAATIDDKLAMKIGSGDWSPAGLKMQVCMLELHMGGPSNRQPYAHVSEVKQGSTS